MIINQKLIEKNFTKGRGGNKIKYIVVHDTGNLGRGANAEAHYRYFNTTTRQASAHYVVDDKQILRIVRDEDTAWHCGDNQKYLNGGGKLKGIVKNSNSIGIEICVNSDGNYEKTVNSTLELIKELMVKHNVPIENVIRHHDVTGKICPRSMSENGWEKWFAFKKLLTEEKDGVKLTFKGKQYIIDGVMKDDKNYVSIRELAELLGFEVGWDNVNKVVIIK